MDFKTIIEKAVKGEDYAADIKDFSPEDSAKFYIDLKKAAEQEAKENINKASATRKERDRVEENFNTRTLQTLKAEQAKKASQRMFSELGIKPEDQAYYTDIANKSESLDADTIALEIKRAYVAKNPDTFINAAKENETLKKSAEDYMRSQAGGNFTPGSPDESKYSEAAKNLFKAWKRDNLKGTLDDAQRIIDKGMTRHF